MLYDYDKNIDIIPKGVSFDILIEYMLSSLGNIPNYLQLFQKLKTKFKEMNF
ncbi:hypothetical protein F6Y05_40990 [Bacillus megaterium]|nr:hypothetical protein [Priestia megaterium]